MGFIGQDRGWVHRPFVNFQTADHQNGLPTPGGGGVTQKTQESEVILDFQDRLCLKEKQDAKNPYPAALCSGLESRVQLSPDS